MAENVTAAFQQQLAKRRQNIFDMFTNPQDAVGDGINKSELAADIEKGEVELDEFNKAVYADTPQNRKLGRVGQEWHRKKKGGAEQPAPKSGGSKADGKSIKQEVQRQLKDYGIYEKHSTFVKKNANDPAVKAVLKKHGFDNLKDFEKEWHKNRYRESSVVQKYEDAFHEMIGAIPAENYSKYEELTAKKSRKKNDENKSAGKAEQNSKILIEELRAEFGVPGVKETKQAKAYRNHIAKLAVDFFNANPNAKFTEEDIQDFACGETEKFEKLKGFKKLNDAIEKYVDSDFDDEEEKAEDNNPFEQYEDEFQKGCGDGDDDIEKEEEDVEDNEDEEETEDDEERTDAEKAEIISLIGIKRLDIWKSQVDEISQLDEDSAEYDEAVKAMVDEIAYYSEVSGIEKSDIMNALSDYNTKLKFKKTGREIKEQLQNVVLPELNANLATAKQEADELLAECGTAPSHDVPEYWTGELHIEMPYKYYEWDETRVPENSNANIIASFSPDSYQKRCCKNAPASQDEAEARCKYNEQVRKVANISTDIKACEIVSKNLKDNESVELSVRQLVSFKFA